MKHSLLNQCWPTKYIHLFRVVGFLSKGAQKSNRWCLILALQFVWYKKVFERSKCSKNLIHATKIWLFPISKYQFDTFSCLKHVFSWINYVISKWYEQRDSCMELNMELDMIMKHEWVIFNVIGHPMYPGLNPDPGTFNKSLIPPNFSNQRLKIFEKFCPSKWDPEFLSVDPWLEMGKLAGVRCLKSICVQLISSSLGEKT